MALPTASPHDPAYRLDGRVAVVTGGGGGIGGAICRMFAAAGAAVACLDIDRASAAAVAADIERAGAVATAHACDVASESSVTAAVDAVVSTLGRPRVLVHCATLLDRSGTVLQIDLAEWNRVIATNLTGAFIVTRAVLPHMIAAGGGSIVNIASMHARQARAGRISYASMKGALVMFTRTLAVDHAPDGIRANTVSPGGTETRRTHFRYKDDPAAWERAIARYPMGRYGQPAEIAAAALFLASDAASFMTGADVVVDGGYTAI